MHMDASTLLGSDIVLMLLGAPTIHNNAQGRVNGITRLEKLLFLASEEEDIQRSVKEPLIFVAYHYGPYSRDVYEAVEILQKAQLLEEERHVDYSTGDDEEEFTTGVVEERSVERRFTLTDDGRAVAGLLGRVHSEVWQALSRVKDKYANLSLHVLFKYVYTTYPVYAERSKIRERFL